jgi:hypothetical protein
MNFQEKQSTILQDLLRINPAMSRLETLLTSSEIESLRNLKKQRAEQFRQLYQAEKQNETEK